MAWQSDIKSFFQLVATHPEIGHVIGNPDENHFWSYQYDELSAAAKSKIKYPALGLSDRTNKSLNSSYQLDGSAIKTAKVVTILIVDQVSNGDFTAQEAVYEALSEVADDIILWISAYAVARLTNRYSFLDMIDLSNVPCTRIGPIGTAPLYGYMIQLSFVGRWINYPGNPLNTILAD